MPDRIQLRRTRGWRLPEGAIAVTRPSPFGNPFKTGAKFITPGHFGAKASPYRGDLPEGEYTRVGQGRFAISRVRERNHAVALFIDWIRHEPSWKPEYLSERLAGRDLGCWCPLPEPGQPDICHAAALIAWVNVGRFWTPGYTDASGASHVTVKRCCNGCGDRLGDVRDSDITDDAELSDVRWECPRCSELLRQSRFETPDTALEWMRETCLAHLVGQGTTDAKQRVRFTQPRTLLAYLERKVLPGDPSILADMTSAALLLNLPLPKTPLPTRQEGPHP